MTALLDPVEWDFDPVPDEEIKWCYLFEYGREARNEILRLRKQRAVQLRPDSAWQRTPSLFKLHAQMIYMDDVSFQPENVQPVLLLSQFHPGEQVGGAPCVEVQGIPDVFFTKTGRARFCLQVDFRNYRNEQIVAAFEQMIRQWRDKLVNSELVNTPPEIHRTNLSPARGRTGRLFDELPDKGGARLSIYRTRLQGLGLMRLRHVMDVPEIRQLFKDRRKPWPASATTDAAVREAIGKTREKVLSWYRELHPELGSESRPERWKPYGH